MRCLGYSLVLMFLLSALPLGASGILFDESGKWSTTFDYPDVCAQRGYDGLVDCRSVQNDGIEWSWGSGIWSGVAYTHATPDANFPGGEGGLGARFWNYDGHNRLSGPIKVGFPGPQRELWIRWYMRYQEGFRWRSHEIEHSIHYNKTFIMRTAVGGADIVPGLLNRYNFRVQGDSRSSFNASGGGWDDTFGPGLSDGNWYCFEIYVKMNSSVGSSDGVMRWWVDGVLKSERSDIRYDNASAVSQEGWTWFDFNNNQNEVANADGPIGLTYAYIDYDDMVVYNQAPPSFDEHGNPFIGPVGWGSGTDPEPQAPVVTILMPGDGSVVRGNEVLVEGTVEPPRSGTVVTINGAGAVHDNGDFSATVGLVPGENAILVVATDEENRQGTASITVVYEQDSEVESCEPPCAPGSICVDSVCVPTEWGCAPDARHQIIVFPAAEVFIGGSSNHLHEADIRLYTWPDETPANAILMKFDLDDLPYGAEVHEALLSLRLLDADGRAQCTPYKVPLHGVLNHDPDLAQATWETYDGVNPWTEEGAQADISATAYDVALVGQEFQFTQWNADDLVREWIAEPNMNFGLFLNADVQAPRDCFRYFAATRHEVVEWHPHLEISYCLEDEGSEPGALVIDFPLDGAVLDTSEVTVTGNINHPDILFVEVNGKEATLEEPMGFTADILLQRGENEIEATGFGTGGELGTHRIKVTFEPTDEEPSNGQPSDGTRDGGSGCNCSSDGGTKPPTSVIAAAFMLLLALRLGRRGNVRRCVD